MKDSKEKATRIKQSSSRVAHFEVSGLCPFSPSLQQPLHHRICVDSTVLNGICTTTGILRPWCMTFIDVDDTRDKALRRAIEPRKLV